MTSVLGAHLESCIQH